MAAVRNGPVALFAGPGAARVLRAAAGGRVSVASYVELGGDHVLVGGVGGPFGPISVAVTHAEDLDLRPGVEAAASPGALRIGSVSISLERMRVRGRAARVGDRAAMNPGIAAAVVARLPPLPAFLEAGLSRLAAGEVDAGVAALAGRGAGLTPEGDDAIAGYAAWRHAVGDPVAMAEAAASLASPIGLSYIRCAERGELPDAAARLLAALVAGDRASALAGVAGLRRWGSSSGVALAHGVLAGAR
jgi:Protein of unknown function (DUF2877)